MKRLLIFILFLLLLSTLASAAVFEDAVGRNVTVPDAPQRIVSLVPSVTETLFALGIESRLVAVTDYCTYPAAATQLPSVGSYAEPGIEAILSHRPDLVIASGDINSQALINKLTQLGIAVYVIHPDSLESALATIAIIGELTGHESQAELLVADIRDRLAKVQQELQERAPVPLLACIMLQPLTVAGPDTLINDLIVAAGGLNIVESNLARYPTWNQESLLLANPQVIILPQHPGQEDPEAFFRKWPQLQAVQSGRIIQIEADWLYRPGPRMILGIEALAKALHPGVLHR
jgi:iron complex transport system substrate-binding protein